MESSILRTIKSMLGPDSDYEVFDQDIIVFINSALMTLSQLGVGPEEGFRITGYSETWDDFFGEKTDIEAVKSYMYMKVKLAFDPPVNSSVASAYNDQCREFEWRLNVAVDPTE